MDNTTKELWARIGVTLKLTDEEIATIFEEAPERHQVVQRVLAEGRYSFDGDCYIPGPSVEDFNADYGTDYECGDYEI